VLGWLILLTGLVNVALVGWVHTVAGARQSGFVRDRLAHLSARSPLEIDLGIFTAEGRRLADHGVRFAAVHDESRWLGVFLGWAQPDVELVIPQLGDDGGSARVEWREVHGALEYVVRIVEAPPAGPGGGAFTVYARRLDTTSAVLPRPRVPFLVTVAACNLLGCGPPSSSGPVAGATRRRPLIGIPSPGDALSTPVTLAWMTVRGARYYRVLVEDVESREVVVDQPTVQRIHEADLPANGRWRARVVAEGGGTVVESPPVVFRTTTRNAPMIVHPELGSTVAAGSVTLRWSAVEGASAYEYLVKEPGSRWTAARGVTSALSTRVDLSSRGGPTIYNVILRACPKDAVCQERRDGSWGPWSIDTAIGVGFFSVEDRPAGSPAGP
jgi:hypothetical protein